MKTTMPTLAQRAVFAAVAPGYQVIGIRDSRVGTTVSFVSEQRLPTVVAAMRAQYPEVHVLSSPFLPNQLIASYKEGSK